MRFCYLLVRARRFSLVVSLGYGMKVKPFSFKCVAVLVVNATSIKVQKDMMTQASSKILVTSAQSRA